MKTHYFAGNTSWYFRMDSWQSPVKMM